MAWSSATTWTFRPDGPVLGGGGVGFDAAFGGVDYSTQLTPILTVTDAVGTSTTTVTSVQGGFTALMNGNGLNVNSQLYQITAFTNANTVTVDRATGTFGGQTANVGGCGAYRGTAVSALEPLHYGVHVAGQTYLMRGTNAAGVTTVPTLASGAHCSGAGSEWLFSRYEGYSLTPGDGGFVDFGTASTGAAVNTANFIVTRNIKYRGSFGGGALVLGGNSQIHENIIADARVGAGYALQNGGSLCRRVWAIGPTSGGASTLRDTGGGSRYEFCRFDATTNLNASIEGTTAPHFRDCLLNGGTAVLQLNNNSGSFDLRNCIVWGGSVTGIDLSVGDLHDPEGLIVENCVIGKNTTYDVAHRNNTVSGNGGQAWVNAAFRCNWFYTLGTRYFQMPAASDDQTLTANPFTSDTTGDFTLNSTAGGGALIRANPCIYAWPDGLNATTRIVGPYGTIPTLATLAGLRSLWRELTNERDTGVVPDTTVDIYLNRGLEALNRLIRYHWTTDSTSIVLVASTQEYSIPADCIDVEWIEWGGKELDKESMDLWRRGTEPWRTEQTGAPRAWALYGQKLIFRPAPDAAAVARQASPIIRYVSKPDDFATFGMLQMNTQDWPLPVYYAAALWSVCHPESALSASRAKDLMDLFNSEAGRVAKDYQERDVQR